jgi:flagellar biosynthesis protein FlhG
MPDQAAEIRRLALRNGLRSTAHDSGPAPIVISGGKPGVGATTLAVHLAAALAAEAQRVVLVDADLYRADVASQCGLPNSLGIADVLAGRKSIHEILQRGPFGFQIAPGSASADARRAVSDRSLQRLLRQMRTLAPHTDCLLVDAGNQPGEITAALWSAAANVLLVTSPDAVAVMDTYALIKTLYSFRQLTQPLHLIVSQADQVTAADVHRRIDQSCRRFLGMSLELFAAIPFDPSAASAARGLCLQDPGETSPLAEAARRLARQINEFRNPAPSQRRLAA